MPPEGVLLRNLCYTILSHKWLKISSCFLQTKFTGSKIHNFCEHVESRFSTLHSVLTGESSRKLQFLACSFGRSSRMLFEANLHCIFTRNFAEHWHYHTINYYCLICRFNGVSLKIKLNKGVPDSFSCRNLWRRDSWRHTLSDFHRSSFQNSCRSSSRDSLAVLQW